MFSIHQLAHKREGVVLVNETFPSLCIILSLGKQLLQISVSNSDLRQLNAVDTTFQLGDFYLTCISLRHVVLEEEAVIPVAYMTHERKFMKNHKIFNEVFQKLGLTERPKLFRS